MSQAEVNLEPRTSRTTSPASVTLNQRVTHWCGTACPDSIQISEFSSELTVWNWQWLH